MWRTGGPDRLVSFSIVPANNMGLLASRKPLSLRYLACVASTPALRSRWKDSAPDPTPRAGCFFIGSPNRPHPADELASKHLRSTWQEPTGCTFPFPFLRAGTVGCASLVTGFGVFFLSESQAEAAPGRGVYSGCTSYRQLSYIGRFFFLKQTCPVNTSHKQRSSQVENRARPRRENGKNKRQRQ